MKMGGAVYKPGNSGRKGLEEKKGREKKGYVGLRHPLRNSKILEKEKQRKAKRKLIKTNQKKTRERVTKKSRGGNDEKNRGPQSET